MKDASIGAATAVVRMLQSNSTEKPSTVFSSPMKTAQLRRSSLEDL